MSEYLKNQEYKKEFLKRIIKDLHQGRDFDEVKQEFDQFIQGVDAVEIADLEQQLIKEGMQPEEITKLCDVHAAIFRDALEKNEQVELIPGHPLYTLQNENAGARKELEEIEETLARLNEGDEKSDRLRRRLIDKVADFYHNIDKHYSKKENIIFPYLERHNITGPPSVMWSVDDEIRDMINDFKGLMALSKLITC